MISVTLDALSYNGMALWITKSALIALNTSSSEFYCFDIHTLQGYYGKLPLAHCLAIAEADDSWFFGTESNIYRAKKSQGRIENFANLHRNQEYPLTQGLFFLSANDSYLVACTHNHETDFLHFIVVDNPSHYLAIPVNASILECRVGVHGVLTSCFDQGGCFIRYDPWPDHLLANDPSFEGATTNDVVIVSSKHDNKRESYFSLDWQNHTKRIVAWCIPLYQQGYMLPIQQSGILYEYNLETSLLMQMDHVIIPHNNFTLERQDALNQIFYTMMGFIVYSTPQGIYARSASTQVQVVFIPDNKILQSAYSYNKQLLAVLDSKNRLSILSFLRSS